MHQQFFFHFWEFSILRHRFGCSRYSIAFKNLYLFFYYNFMAEYLMRTQNLDSTHVYYCLMRHIPQGPKMQCLDPSTQWPIQSHQSSHYQNCPLGLSASSCAYGSFSLFKDELFKGFLFLFHLHDTLLKFVIASFSVWKTTFSIIIIDILLLRSPIWIPLATLFCVMTVLNKGKTFSTQSTFSLDEYYC